VSADEEAAHREPQPTVGIKKLAMRGPLLVGGADERTRRLEPPDAVDDVVDLEVTKLQQWARGDLNPHVLTDTGT